MADAFHKDASLLVLEVSLQAADTKEAMLSLDNKMGTGEGQVEAFEVLFLNYLALSMI